MAALEVIILDDAGGLKEFDEVESALSVFSEAHPTDDKYKSLAEAYQSASSWTPDDKFSPSWPYSLIQRYLPGITEY